MCGTLVEYLDWHQLMELIHFWRAPSKRGMWTNFVVIFQVARNALKFAMPTLFVLQNVPVFVFHKWEKKASNTFLKVHPRPSNGETHVHSVLVLRIEILHCLETEREREAGGGGGGGICTILSVLFCPIEKKGHCNTIKSWHAKFQCLLSNLKNGNEIH